MGLRGPLPKLKVVDGTYQPPANIPRPKPELPRMPTGLTDEAKREWRRVARPLFDLGLLTELDKNTLALYCELVGRYERAQAALLEKGDTFVQPNGVPKQRPEYYIMKDCLKEIRAFIKQFGLSPAARMRMELPEPQEPDELENLLD